MIVFFYLETGIIAHFIKFWDHNIMFYILPVAFYVCTFFSNEFFTSFQIWNTEMSYVSSLPSATKITHDIIWPKDNYKTFSFLPVTSTIYLILHLENFL